MPEAIRKLRGWRNRALRIHLRTTTDMDKARSSRWTWGSVGSDATEAWQSPLSIIHDLGTYVGLFICLDLPSHDDVPQDDPLWDEAVWRWR